MGTIPMLKHELTDMPDERLINLFPEIAKLNTVSRTKSCCLRFASCCHTWGKMFVVDQVRSAAVSQASDKLTGLIGQFETQRERIPDVYAEEKQRFDDRQAGRGRCCDSATGGEKATARLRRPSNPMHRDTVQGRARHRKRQA